MRYVKPALVSAKWLPRTVIHFGIHCLAVEGGLLLVGDRYAPAGSTRHEAIPPTSYLAQWMILFSCVIFLKRWLGNSTDPHETVSVLVQHQGAG